MEMKADISKVRLVNATGLENIRLAYLFRM